MKYFLLFLSALLIWFAYMFNTSAMFRHYYNLVTDAHATDDSPLIYKELRMAKDINGEYKFSCKYPELYEIGIGRKASNVDLKGDKYNWVENSPIRFKVDIISKDGEVIFSEIINNFILGGISRDVAALIPLSNCKDLVLHVKLIDGDFKEFENLNGLLYLYLSVSGYI